MSDQSGETSGPSGGDGFSGVRAEFQKQSVLDEILRVDHAGEYGAVRIYQGQLAVTRDPETRKLLQHMLDQEIEHLENLEAVMPDRRVRPSALLYPVWDLGGFILGAATAAMGTRAAMACTVAVEDVIVEHYDDQLRTLHQPGFEDEGELRAMIKKHRDEEQEHHDTGLANEAEQAPFYDALTGIIKLGCRAAVFVAKKI